MAINTRVSIDASFLLRWMTVGQMKRILSELDDSLFLFPNRVGNITVTASADDTDYLGYIDFNSETYEPGNEPDQITKTQWMHR